MTKATLFEFTSHELQPSAGRAVFHYKTIFDNGSEIPWTETIAFPKPIPTSLPKDIVQKIMEGLHIMLGISYYKFHYAPSIKTPYALTKGEAGFFTIVYKKGLGEFLYQNKLDPSQTPKFPARVTSNPQPVTRKLPVTGYSLPVTNRVLVGIGGGKDSIVSLELLKQYNFSPTAFVVESKSSTITDDIVRIAGIGSLKIHRHLDEKVHQPHPHNGHIPISAIYAFLGTAAAIFYGYRYIVVSNEHSSNFGNANYKGLDVNHQWSKSLEFETLFQDYVRQSLTPGITYFSLLRPFHEIRIVKLFTKLGKKYFGHFSSCNRNFTIKDVKHQGLWCGQCAKCVFAWLLLSAFLPKKQLVSMFGKNLYQDQALLPLFKDVLGFGTMKPFDCVGTFEEAQTALVMARKQYGVDIIMRQIGKRAKASLQVFKTQPASIPEPFIFLGMENALILGYGKEGQTTKQYLKKYWPKLKVTIGDEAKDKAYLKKQAGFDIAIKTPGLPKSLVTIPYTTATNIFFGNTKRRNIIIGVTGSKGKSTTASLICHILKIAGNPSTSLRTGDAVLLGNIGTPMLWALMQPVPKNRIFVLELSSYQLDDIKYSPDIAVVTSLFPEHLDFHGSLEKYYNAKRNIIRHQAGQDVFIYNPSDLRAKSWTKTSAAKTVPFLKHTFKSNLLGEHNQNNIRAAAAAAMALGIELPTIDKALETFKNLPHRLDNIGTFQGITFYDDAISTTPESTIEAVKTLKNIGTILLGGTDRGYDFSTLEKIIRQYKIKNIVLFPQSGSRILKNTKGLNILHTRSMKEAVAFVFKHAPKGSICLLSCASPSYSLWKNFEEKGGQFQKWVEKLNLKFTI